jgi:uncharacterized membrane protein
MSVERSSIDSERAFVLLTYVLHLLGAAVGFTSIIGLILNYVRRDQFGPPLDSHHRWMISSFWWALLWSVLGCLMLWAKPLAWVIFGVVWLWYIYRHVRGLIALANGEPMPV